MKIGTLFLNVFIIVAMLITSENLSAQNNSRYVRIARIVIDSAKIEDYNKALKEHAEAAVKVEPGVLMLYAVSEKANPVNVTVFEIYASVDAYNFHITTPHFLKYKSTVQDMVKNLQLIDVTPIALEAKKK